MDYAVLRISENTAAGAERRWHPQTTKIIDMFTHKCAAVNKERIASPTSAFHFTPTVTKRFVNPDQAVVHFPRHTENIKHVHENVSSPLLLELHCRKRSKTKPNF